jgi:hypothetical protein
MSIVLDTITLSANNYTDISIKTPPDQLLAIKVSNESPYQLTVYGLPNGSDSLEASTANRWVAEDNQSFSNIRIYAESLISISSVFSYSCKVVVYQRGEKLPEGTYPISLSRGYAGATQNLLSGGQYLYGSLSGRQYQLWSLDYPNNVLYDNLDSIPQGAFNNTFRNAPTGQSYTVTSINGIAAGSLGSTPNALWTGNSSDLVIVPQLAGFYASGDLIVVFRGKSAYEGYNSIQVNNSLVFTNSAGANAVCSYSGTVTYVSKVNYTYSLPFACRIKWKTSNSQTEVWCGLAGCDFSQAGYGLSLPALTYCGIKLAINQTAYKINAGYSDYQHYMELGSDVTVGAGSAIPVFIQLAIP